MSQSGSKPYEISKQVVVAAFEKVSSKKGAPGIDGVTVEQFAQGSKNNLYKLWNRMSSGSYFPSPVRMVEIPKDGGRGTRVLGVPTVADRTAQTVAVAYLEPLVERCSTPTPTGTVRVGHRWTRWRPAGRGAGSTGGFSIWISKVSSTTSIMI
jgi:retron-type reverse transcriptase